MDIWIRIGNGLGLEQELKIVRKGSAEEKWKSEKDCVQKNKEKQQQKKAKKQGEKERKIRRQLFVFVSSFYF